MRPEKDIEQRLEQLAEALDGRDSFVDEVMRRIEAAPVPTGSNAKRTIGLGRLVMKTSIRFTAAALVVIAALLSLTLFDQTVTPAYGLEQTVKACHSVRFIHMRQIDPRQAEEPILIWAEFFEDGGPKAIRLHQPAWKTGGDGAKEIVWKDDIAEVWFKKKNSFLRVRDQQLAEQILKIIQEQDPKFLVQSLMDREHRGECEIQIDVPADKGDPILVTSISLPDRDGKQVFHIDQSTQLPLRGETYALKDGGWVLMNIGEFYDYNQPIDPSIFAFDNLPEDLLIVDQVTQPVGLEQGNLTDDEAAVETARRFWQAIQEEAYDRAGQYLEGAPGEFLRQAFVEKMQIKVVEIVSVGPVEPHPNPETGGVVVPCTLKVERNGQMETMTFDRLGVRQVYNQPGRWTIFGGL